MMIQIKIDRAKKKRLMNRILQRETLLKYTKINKSIFIMHLIQVTKILLDLWYSLITEPLLLQHQKIKQ